MYVISMLANIDPKSISIVEIATKCAQISISTAKLDSHPSDIFIQTDARTFCWDFDFSNFGVCPVSGRITIVPRLLDYNIDRLRHILNTI
jgi:hypothetical protein